MNRDIIIFITLNFAGLASSPAFASVDKQIAFWKTFKKEFEEANNKLEEANNKLEEANNKQDDYSNEENKILIKSILEKFKRFLYDEACAESKGFRADGGLLCFNPTIRQIATYYCKEVAQKQNWEKTKCATAEKSFWRKIIKGILGDIKKIKDIHKEKSVLVNDKNADSPKEDLKKELSQNELINVNTTSDDPIKDKFINSTIADHLSSLEINEYKETIESAMEVLNLHLKIKKLDDVEKSDLCTHRQEQIKRITYFCHLLYTNQEFNKSHIISSLLPNSDSNSKFDNLLIVKNDALMKKFIDFLCKGTGAAASYQNQEGKYIHPKSYKYLVPLGKFSFENIKILLEIDKRMMTKKSYDDVFKSNVTATVLDERGFSGAVATIKKLCQVSKE